MPRFTRHYGLKSQFNSRWPNVIPINQLLQDAGQVFAGFANSWPEPTGARGKKRNLKTKQPREAVLVGRGCQDVGCELPFAGELETS